jgi:hypothetical protein
MKGISLSRRWLLLAAAWTAILAGSAAAQEPAKTVRLTVDYGDGVQKVFSALPWQAELTVLDALQAAARHPRGIKFTHRGSGASAFVTAIDDVKNEGRGRNWTYLVNDKRADKSAGVWELKAGDAIVWRFSDGQ